MKFVDITGKRYGEWFVLERNINKKSRTYWVCRCSCGNIRNIEAGRLKAGDSTKCKSCSTRGHKTTHGLVYHPMYSVWLGMKKRCYRDKESNYRWYGGRGIQVCKSWLDSFESFYKDMVESYKAGLQIDRKNNDGNYEPGNCRWVTGTVNVRNSTAAKLNIEAVKKIKEMIALTRYCFEVLGTDHMVIDSLMKCGISTKDHDAQKSFIDTLCTLAKDNNKHAHLVAHARKGSDEFARPTKADVKGAGDITDQCDNVLLVWDNKKKYLELQKDEPDQKFYKQPDLVLMCRKQRNGPWEGDVNLWFHGPSLQHVANNTNKPMDLCGLNDAIVDQPEIVYGKRDLQYL